MVINSHIASKLLKDNNTKERLLLETEISLLLNSYEDIFSDFDPRPDTVRALSGDFLEAARKASIDKLGKLEVEFLIPKKQRDYKREKIIIKRLRKHFRRHYNLLSEDKNKIIKKGLIFILIGAVVMFGASYLYFLKQQHNLAEIFLYTILSPAGWFFFWEGLADIFNESKIKDPDLEFYKKMTHANIRFYGY